MFGVAVGFEETFMFISAVFAFTLWLLVKDGVFDDDIN